MRTLLDIGLVWGKYRAHCYTGQAGCSDPALFAVGLSLACTEAGLRRSLCAGPSDCPGTSGVSTLPAALRRVGASPHIHSNARDHLGLRACEETGMSRVTRPPSVQGHTVREHVRHGVGLRHRALALALATV